MNTQDVLALLRTEVPKLVRAELAAVRAERRGKRKPSYVKKTGPRKINYFNVIRTQQAESWVRLATEAILKEVASVGSITVVRARELVKKRNAVLKALDQLRVEGKLVRLAGVYTAPSTPAPAIE